MKQYLILSKLKLKLKGGYSNQNYNEFFLWKILEKSLFIQLLKNIIKTYYEIKNILHRITQD